MKKSIGISKELERKNHIVDAAGKSLGRIASQIALILRGKNNPDFSPHKETGDFVVVKNIKKIRLTGKKLEKKKYYHHSGYLGGLKEIPLRKVFQNNPGEVLKRAVFGMLPKNRLRAKQIKKLKIED